MKRLLAALLIAATCFPTPASAQTTAEQQAVIEMQALLADVGRWAQEHAAVMDRAGEPLSNIEAFVLILDSFTAGEIDARTATARMEAWRRDALGAIDDSRAAARTLRAPPALDLLGADGARLSVALNATYNNVMPTIDEMERVTRAVGDLGVSSLRNPDGVHTAKERVLYQTAIQLVRVDLARIEVVTASLGDDHPNQALMSATQYYYATLIDVPQFAIDEMEGRGDRAALVSALRRNVQSMRSELDRAEVLTSRLVERMRAMQAGPAVDMVRSILEMAETFPLSIRAYRGLADAIDEAAAALERGEDVVDVWADQAERDEPYLNEIGRLEQVRAAMVANNNRTPL